MKGIWVFFYTITMSSSHLKELIIMPQNAGPQVEAHSSGILTATADEGFPTPSSSGTEASGAE